MIKVRTVFEKKGRAKYISHLDLNLFMMRVFRRSGLPIWYTEGYNPHPYINFALALSLGFESECEVMDFNLTEGVSFGKIKKSLNDVMPEGLKILSVVTPEHNVKDIEKAEYHIEFLTELPENLYNEVYKFLESDEINVEKKTKKGITEIDIKPFTEITDISKSDNSVIIDMRLPAGTQTNLNPMLFYTAFRNVCPIEFNFGGICRKKIICADGEIFR